MCLLIVSKKGLPHEEVLRLGDMQNPHGAGIAWTESGKVKWKKGLKLEELEQFRDLTGPVLVHFRFASSGGQRAELNHPFTVDARASTALEGEAEMVMMHNGHWHGFSKSLMENVDYPPKELPKGPWSDTRAIAWLGHIKGVNFFDNVKEKIATLSSNGEINIYREKDFSVFEDGNLILSYNPFTFIRKPKSLPGHGSVLPGHAPATNQNTNHSQHCVCQLCINKRSNFNSYDDWAEAREEAMAEATLKDPSHLPERAENCEPICSTNKPVNYSLNYRGFQKYKVIQLPNPIANPESGD